MLQFCRTENPAPGGRGVIDRLNRMGTNGLLVAALLLSLFSRVFLRLFQFAFLVLVLLVFRIGDHCTLSL